MSPGLKFKHLGQYKLKSNLAGAAGAYAVSSVYGFERRRYGEKSKQID